MKNLGIKLAAVGITGAGLFGGAMFISKHEGFVPGTYIDPAGIVTACFGHVSPELQVGQQFSDLECLELFSEDLHEHNQELLQSVHVELTPEEHAAYLSFHYNVGASQFNDSTLLKFLNQGDRIQACNELPRWVFSGGQVLPGLIERRRQERELCLEGVSTYEIEYQMDSDCGYSSCTVNDRGDHP